MRYILLPHRLGNDLMLFSQFRLIELSRLNPAVLKLILHHRLFIILHVVNICVIKLMILLCYIFN
jgi:hypothetical protein